MSGLDLTAVERVLVEWMVDDLVIYRDGGTSDDQLDPDTLLLTPNAGTVVWSGKGAVQTLANFTDQGDPDVVRIIDETDAEYRALLPMRVDIPVQVGDLVAVAAVHGTSSDPRLQGRGFSVVHLGHPSTFAVARFVYLRPAGVVDVPIVTPPPLTGGGIPFRGDGPPGGDVEGVAGSIYIDNLTGDIYEWSNP